MSVSKDMIEENSLFQCIQQAKHVSTFEMYCVPLESCTNRVTQIVLLLMSDRSIWS